MAERCPFCGQSSGVIWVRAHYQCAACGQVIVPCCNGETAASTAVARPVVRRPVEPGPISALDESHQGKDA